MTVKWQFSGESAEDSLLREPETSGQAVHGDDTLSETTVQRVGERHLHLELLTFVCLPGALRDKLHNTRDGRFECKVGQNEPQIGQIRDFFRSDVSAFGAGRQMH